MVEERIPAEWRKSTLIPIYKNKGGYLELQQLPRYQADESDLEALGENSR